MFALITFCCVRTVAGGDLVNYDCIDVACCSGYADGFGWYIYCAATYSFNDEHSELVSLGSVGDENESKR